jgi:predicted house-cleaning noncanonical NTP pyrophosphatase (MazG superfamily)
VKALGLLALPEPWVPPFFVIASEAVPAANDEGFFKLCREALKQSALAPEVIVRSSGVAETMQHRGRLVSEVCSAADVPTVVQRLARAVETDHTDHVHWVVQANVKPSRQGHLSNERRLSYEPRDWVLEVEQQDQRPGYTSPIAIRTWRDGSLQSATELRCGSEAQIALQLKSVSVWALQFGRRMHFEWVWTGSRLWIVQADLADTNVGVDPHSLLPTEIPAITPAMLAVVVPATSEQLSRYGKLRNVQLYAQLGYAMPQFYMLESESILQSVLHGHVPAELASDLEELTKRPLIIRTDGSAIPADKREMLPRSDELRSAADAVKWLTTDFRNRVLAAHLETAGLCLIAHHFIPSIASAWARAEPKKRMVRIESLWGLPEGLYWYSHDTFEVDSDTGGFTDRRRYKGTFVASDSEGRWIPMTTAAPFDWRRSIRRTEWIREIASTTRTIADRAGYSVSVMWLVDNDSRVTSHRVLPWFHSKSALSGAPKAAPRKKLTTARDQTVQNRSDWEHTKTQIAAGRHIERLIVAPVDPDLIRDQQFVEELATAAARHQIVIELAGGVLSHAYYVLTRHGAQVECVDLFGTDPEIREFNKLVRDKIPRSIQARGEDVAVVSLKGDAYLAALRQKLVEEAYEALDARGGGEIVAELADVQEVVRAISHALQIPFSQVEEEREDKRLKKGGFERGVMLTTTSTPYSLSREETEAKPTTLEGDPGGIPQPTVLRPEEIPTNPPYRKPDLRTAGDKPEKLFTFETELSRTTDRLTKQTTTFVMPVDRESSREFTLTIEFSRERGVLRVTVRFRLEPQQLPIGLDDQLRLDFREDERTVESPNETSQAARKKD